MTDKPDVAYFRSRAEAERKLATFSIDPVVAAVHRTLADAYADRINGTRDGTDQTAADSNRQRETER